MAASRGAFRDAFGLFAVRESRPRPPRAPPGTALGLERSALADLDLDVRTPRRRHPPRYIELVKRCHPDANGGDRSAEHKLQGAPKAYKTLRKARLA